MPKASDMFMLTKPAAPAPFPAFAEPSRKGTGQVARYTYTISPGTVAGEALPPWTCAVQIVSGAKALDGRGTAPCQRA